ncbi:hypothetical protein BJ165DRAFT_1523309 [Panaeolus papilionaceus]|nr:hypothetical protein BJ165DRAFT_1523309 [Panaeolus papilionaceus]
MSLSPNNSVAASLYRTNLNNLNTFQSVLATFKSSDMANLFNPNIPITLSQPLPPDISQPAATFVHPIYSDQFKVTSTESAAFMAAIISKKPGCRSAISANV